MQYNVDNNILFITPVLSVSFDGGLTIVDDGCFSYCHSLKLEIRPEHTLLCFVSVRSHYLSRGNLPSFK